MLYILDGTYVYHQATTVEMLRMLCEGHVPNTWERERDPKVCDYANGWLPPNYPVPVVIR